MRPGARSWRATLPSRTATWPRSPASWAGTGSRSRAGCAGWASTGAVSLKDLVTERDDTKADTIVPTPRSPGGEGHLSPSTLVDRFVVLEVLGAGGMGVVYSAYDSALDRKVALKLLGDTWRAQASDIGTARLLREAQAMARVSHPNVITVREVGTWQNSVYIAMDRIEGQTLRAWLRERRRPARHIVEAFVQAGRGLAAAHEHGLVHRDFKPDNVLIATDGRVLVSD